MIEKIYKFSSTSIIRSPLYSINQLELLNESYLKELLCNKAFKETLWLASPVLYDESLKWLKGQLNNKSALKVKISITKYYQRLCTRVTPFGLFSSISVLQPYSESNMDINAKSNGEIIRKSRLDMELVCKVISIIEDRFLRSLSYKINSSIYFFDKNWRYVEYTNVKTRRKYNLCEVSNNVYLESVINSTRDYRTYNEIINTLVLNDIDASDAEEYVDELINNKILVSNLEPQTITEDSLDDLIRELMKIEDSRIKLTIDILNQIKDSLSELDNNVYNEIDLYNGIINKIESLGIIVDKGKAFQVDTYRVAKQISTTPLDKNEIIRAIDYLYTIHKPKVKYNITQFIKRFNERYEGLEIPLTTILDNDIGIGYPADQDEKYNTPIIDDINIRQTKPNDSLEVSLVDKHLFNILNEASNKGLYEIVVDTNDPINQMSRDVDIKTFASKLQNTQSLVSNYVNVEGKECIQIVSMSGNSAIDYTGRFGYLNNNVKNYINDLAKEELALQNGFIIAEVVHLPEDRAVNVILHPKLYDYQIQYLGKSSVDNRCTIDINDLLVCVIDNKIYLKSKKLNKFVIPRLSNVHNYRFRTLPIYYFLCDIQNQSEYRGVSFHWGTLGDLFDFTPRVRTSQDIILYPATWRIKKSEINHLYDLLDQKFELINAINIWKSERKIPDNLLLSDGDNELYIDLTNELSIIAFLQEVKQRYDFIVKEFFAPSKQLIFNESDIHVIQNVTSLIKHKDLLSPPPNEITASTLVDNKLIPGGDVLFYKIYSGKHFLENFLISTVTPLIKKLIEEKLVDKWFFIRYNDSDGYHLRLRLFPSQKGYIGKIILMMEDILKEYVQNQSIWKVCIDTYNREHKRYNYQSLVYSELFFHYDSECITNVLKYLHDNNLVEEERGLITIYFIDRLLDAFSLDLQDKYQLLLQVRNSFFVEYGGNKLLNEKLSLKFRAYKNKIRICLNSQYEYQKYVDNMFDMSASSIKSIVEQSNVNSIKRILISFIHMHINRMMLSDPRKHELIIYDLLERYYKSEIALLKVK